MRIAREALLRKALLGSTALIGITIATPALAQSATPAEGGTISGYGSFYDNTGAHGGVFADRTLTTGVTMTDVTIIDTTGTPPDAYFQIAMSNQDAVLTTVGDTTLLTNQSGGAAVAMSASTGNLTWSIGRVGLTSVIDLTGSYGAKASASGSVQLIDRGATSGLRNITASGSAVAGIYAASSYSTTEVSLKAPLISGFATGISASSPYGTSVTTTGGAITAGTAGIDAQSGANVTVISGGTIDGSGTPQYGIYALGGGAVAITANGVIGGSAAAAYGIWAQAGAFMGNRIDVNANVTGTTAGIATGGTKSFTITVAAGKTVNGSAGAGVDLSSGGSLNNSGTVAGAAQGVTAAGTGALSLTNQSGGTITGGSTGVSFGASADATGSSFTNSGTITGTGGGSIGVSLLGSTGSVSLANGATGIIAGLGDGVVASRTVNLVNQGVIGTGTVSSGVLVLNGSGDAVRLTGNNSTVVNLGAIATVAGNAVALSNGGTVTNVANALLTGGASGYALSAANGATLNNYGVISGSAGMISSGGTMLANLYAGSSIGAITLGSSDDTLSIYNGRGTADSGSVINSITYQRAGTLAAASYGAIDLGAGVNTLALRGTGDGSAAHGATASLNLANAAGVGRISKLDGGTWTLTGTATGVTAGATISANGGTLIFDATSGLTGAITVDGGIIRANSAGAFGSGTIILVDPTLQYGATGTYANPIVLASADPVSDPTHIQADAGVNATLTGLISQSGGAAQPVIFDGAGTVTLTNGSNSWAGLTTISNGAVFEYDTGRALGEGGVTINAGALLDFVNSSPSSGYYIEGGTYGGAGTILFSGAGGSSGFLFGGYTPALKLAQAAGGVVEVANANVYSASVDYTGNLGSLYVGTGGNFYVGGDSAVFAAVTGTANIGGGQNGTGTLTVGAGNGSGSFSGTLTDRTAVSGVLAFTKIGGGLQSLTGANTYTGATTISGGTLALGGTGTLGSTAITNNAAFDISGHVGPVSILNMTGTGSTVLGANALTLTSANGTYSGAIGGTGSLTLRGGGLYTLTGFSSYTGGTTVTGSGTHLVVGNGAGSGRITGNISVDTGATLTFSRSDNYDFTSAISGAGTVQALGTVSLSGAITNTGALNVDSAIGGTVTLTGARSGASVSAVTMAGAGNTLRVGLTGSVGGGQYLGVRLGGTGNGIDNFGSVTNIGTGGDSGWGAAIGVTATSGASVINNGSGSNSTATISGQNSGINHLSSGIPAATGLLTVNNYGLIAGTLRNGIENQSGTGGLTVSNYATGRIEGGTNGILVSSGTTSALSVDNVDNNGTIIGNTRDGIENLSAAGSRLAVNNHATGVIAGLGNGTPGTGSGIVTTDAVLTLSNAGVIRGLDQGIYTGAVSFTLTGNTGIIAGQANGIVAGGAVAVTNSGTIGTGTVSGTVFTAGNGGAALSIGFGAVTNNAGGLIASGNDAGVVFTGSGSAQLTNASGATIRGSDGVTANSASVAAIINSGVIETVSGGSGYGVALTSGTITNNLGGVIRQQSGSGGTAVYATGTATLLNYGTISNASASAYGVRILGVGRVTNTGSITANSAAVALLGAGNNSVTNSGSISGSYGIGVRNGAVTITNTGTIGGTTAAIDLGATFDDTLNLNDGTIDGAVNLYGGADTINLRGGTVNGAIALGDGNDTFNWNGGTFSSTIDGGTGTDTFNATLATPATLNLANVSNFENYNLLAGTLTVTGTTPGAWALSGNTVLNVGAAGQAASLTNTGYKVTMTGVRATVNVAAGSTLGSTASSAIYASGSGATISNGGTISGTRGIMIDGANGSVINSGAITGTSDVGVMLFANGSVTNSAGGTITANVTGGSGVRLQNTTASVSNAGTITGGVSGIGAAGSLTLTNSGTVRATQGYGVLLGSDTGIIINSGTIAGGSESYGDAIRFSSSTGSATITNQSGGKIIGGGGAAIWLANGSVLINLNAGSTLTGDVVSSGNGTRTITIGGTFDGNYLADGSAADTITLAAGGSIVRAEMGTGHSIFNYNGGSFTSVDGGLGTDSLQVNLATPGTLNLASVTGFENRFLVGGTLTVTGTQTDAGGWTLSPGTTLNIGTAGLAANLTVSGTNKGVTVNGVNGTVNIAAGSTLVSTGSDAIFGNSNGMTVSNAGTLGGVVAIGSGSSVTNLAGGTITGVRGVEMDGANATVINSGTITGTGGQGVIMFAGGSITNNAGATITATGATSTAVMVQGNASYVLTNDGTITGVNSGVSIASNAQLTLINSGNIRATTGTAVNLINTNSSLTNSGTITGSSFAVRTSDGNTLTNQSGGVINGGGNGAISLQGIVASTLVLEAGSTTNGNIVVFGSGARTVDISGALNGNYDSSPANAADTVSLHTGGSIANANLGTGDDTFLYYGGTITGMIDGGDGNDRLFGDFGAGSSGTVSLASFTNFEAFGVISGDVTITGPSSNPATTIYAGVDGTPSGTITFTDTANLTGDIYINGGSIRASTAGAFGSGTIHMIDPTATFGATGTYGNNVSLEVASPSSANPATLNTNGGVAATLTGAITTGTGPGVDANQNLVIGGAGTIVLTNTANSWNGTTTINTGATLRGASDTISGSAIVDNGTLAYQQAYSGTVSQNISGNGALTVSGLAAGNILTFAGNSTLAGTITVLDGSAIGVSGTVNSGSSPIAVALNGDGASLTNSGSITSTLRAVDVNGVGASVTNLAGGAIGGGDFAITATGANVSLGNYGSISTNGAATAAALVLTGDYSTVTNYAGGTISGWRGVEQSGAGAAVTNYGTINGLSDRAISLNNGGTATNALGGVLNATSPLASGIFIQGDGTATNAGTINADSGIVFNGAGTHAAINSGTINGIASGVTTSTGSTPMTLTNSGTIAVTNGDGVLYMSGGTLTNSGAITGGASGYGIETSGATTITNQAGGTIAGGLGAMYLGGADLITVNLDAGSTTTGVIGSVGTGDRAIAINGTLNGSYVGGDGVDAITLGTSATVTGTLDGGAGNDTLTLAGTGSATLGAIANIESATKSGTGTWTLAAPTGIGAWTIADGTLLATGGNAIADTASVAMTGGTLQLGASEGIGTLSGTGTVALGTNALALFGTGTNFAGAITGTGNVEIQGTATLSGANTFTGTTLVSGNLTLGASDVLGDGSTLLVQAGATADLGANSDTVAAAAILGTLAGTGTLTAAQYELSGATVNANLGAGTVFTLGGTSTLNGTVGGNVAVQAGTLALGASNRLADGGTVMVASGATLDLGAFSDTVGALGLSGTLAGTGTLTAAEYGLTGATVNANLGAGTLINLGGTSTLNSTADGDVAVQAGTLALGASNRLADGAAVEVAAGATLDLGANSDTVSALGLGGTLAGSGTLTAAEYGLTGATVNANLGGGTLINLGGTSTLNGVSAALAVSVNGGTLALGASDRLADAATVAVASGATLDLGANSDVVGALGLGGTLAGTGTLSATEYDLTGATVNANLGAGTLINLGGTSTLNGASAALAVSVNGGTLALGASGRLADTATVAIASGAVLDLGANSDTVGLLGLNGTLAGSGTLTAGEYQLSGATVNANLGTGTVFNLGGISVLNGTAGGDLSVQAGTLGLGASDRLADGATVVVAAGATLDLGAFNDTVGTLGLDGTLAGTGTLSAAEYDLTGATVNANLGAGTLINLGGASVLNGTAAASAVSINGGTLVLGASDRLADTATVAIASGATFDLGGNSDTVRLLGLNGTLAGTGTLTAGEYQLTGATVNANLGAGTVVNLGGASVLNGTAAANTVTVQAGTLRLGASDRLADTATLGVASGATFDLATYDETVAALAGTGTIALGSGRLTLNSASSSGFGGAITGSGTIDKQGIGTLTLAGTFANTDRFDVSAGTLAFSGSTQGGIRVQGGTLIGGGSLAGALTVSSGTFSPGGLSIGTLGAIDPIGSFTVGSLAASGGTLLFDFGGIGLNFASDSIKVNGTATLTGGTVAVNALTSAASDYRFNQLYTIIQANSLTGTFANGSAFATVASNPNLKWRLRYDLVANAVVLQVQKNMEFTDGVAPGDVNTRAVANALGSSSTVGASDQWSATLNAITGLSTSERVAAFKSFSGEILANVSTATISANNLFAGLLRQRLGDGSDALVGGGFTGASLTDVRSTATASNSFASALSGATLPGAAESDGGKTAIWGQAYGGYQKLLGDGVHAGLDNTIAGVAMGIETRMDGFTAGIAGGVAQVDSDMDSRFSTVSGNQYQLGGYMSYDAGVAFVAASGNWYSSDLDSKRTLAVGATTTLATGDIHATGYSLGITGGFRADLGNGLRLALIGSAAKVRNQQDGFTENAAGGLGLQMASANRDLFTAGGELRLGATVKAGAGTAMPWVSMGVRYNSGDLDTVGNVRFSGAPAGTGSFGVSGTRIAPVLGTLGVGIDARASKNVRLGIALEGSAGENTREGRASVRVKIGF